MEQEKSKLTQYCVFSAKTIEYEICRKDWRLRKIVDVASRTAINSFFSELAPSRMLRLWPLGPPGRYFNRNGGPSSPATARWAEGGAAGLGFGRPNKLMWRLCESSTSKIFAGHAWRQGSRTRKAVCLTKDDLEIFRFFSSSSGHGQHQFGRHVNVREREMLMGQEESDHPVGLPVSKTSG